MQHFAQILLFHLLNMCRVYAFGTVNIICYEYSLLHLIIKINKQNELHMEINLTMFEIIQGHSTQQQHD